MAPKAKTAKTLKAVRAMKRLGYSEKIVRPVLKELLKLYDDNWMLIEDESYQVLIDAILQSEDQKVSWLSASKILLSLWIFEEWSFNFPLPCFISLIFYHRCIYCTHESHNKRSSAFMEFPVFKYAYEIFV